MESNNFEKKFNPDFMSSTPEEYKYYQAVEQVKRVKGFYNHLIVYVIMNIFFVVVKYQKVDEGESIWEALYVTFFWGLGLLVHALRVFNWIPFLGKDWEEKKIMEFLEQQKNKENDEHRK